MAFLPSQLHTCQVFNLQKGNSLISKGSLNIEGANWENWTVLNKSNEKDLREKNSWHNSTWHVSICH